MTRKEELNQKITDMIAVRSEYTNAIRDIKSDPRYSQEHRLELANQKDEVYKSHVQPYMKAAIAVVADAIKQINGAVVNLRATRSASEYAPRFMAAVEMIKLASKSLNKQDLEELAAPFTADPIALAALRSAAEQQGLDASSIHVGPSSTNAMDVLNNLKDQLEKYAGCSAQDAPPLSLLISLDIATSTLSDDLLRDMSPDPAATETGIFYKQQNPQDPLSPFIDVRP